MKWVFFLQLVIGLNNLGAQNKDSIDTVIFVSSKEIMPKWTQGTNEELIQDIKARIKFPNDTSIEGTTYLHFEIDTFGQVNNPKIFKSISKDIDDQLLKLIWNYKFEPGFQRDKKVETHLYLPLRIKQE